MFFMIGLALRGLFDKWAERAGWVIITLVVRRVRLVHLRQPAGRSRLSAARRRGRAWAAVVHIAGDMVTSAGVPILWPIPIDGASGLHDRCAGRDRGLRSAARSRRSCCASHLTVVSLLAPSGWSRPPC